MISDHTIPTPIAKIHSIPTSLISYHFSVPRQVASPSDYAARANSEGAKLSFAFMVFDSTPNFHTCRSYFDPIKKKFWHVWTVNYTNNITTFISIYSWFVIFDFVVSSSVNQVFTHNNFLLVESLGTAPRSSMIPLDIIKSTIFILYHRCLKLYTTFFV